MASGKRNFILLAAATVTGVGFAMRNSWVRGLLGLENHREPKDYDGEAFDEVFSQQICKQTIVSRYATKELYQEYKDVSTPAGFTLIDALKYGLHDAATTANNAAGLLAGDEECYHLFTKIFDPVIEEVRGFKGESLSHNDSSTSTTSLDGCYVLSCRARVLRSLRGFPFAWFCSQNERMEVQEIATNALQNLEGVLSDGSQYYELSTLDSHVQNSLLDTHSVFTHQRSDINKTWSQGRGLWRNKQYNTIVLVNEQEHLKFVTQHFGPDLRHAFARLCDIVKRTEKFFQENGHEFMYSDSYGYLASSPRELGTGLRVSVNVRLPYLMKEPRFAFILNMFGLERRIPGLQNSSCHSIVEISNADRLGLTEAHFVQHVIDGVNYLVAMEKLLEKGHVIDPLLCDVIRFIIPDSTHSEQC